MAWTHILTVEPNYSSISIQNSSDFWTHWLLTRFSQTDSRVQHYLRYSQAKTKQPTELLQNINCQLITICFLHFYHSFPAPWLLRHRYHKWKDIQLILSIMHKQESQHFHLSSFPDRIMCSSYFNHQLEDKNPQLWVFSHSQHVLDSRTNFFHAHTGWFYSAHSNCNDFCSPSPKRSKKIRQTSRILQCYVNIWADLMDHWNQIFYQAVKYISWLNSLSPRKYLTNLSFLELLTSILKWNLAEWTMSKVLLGSKLPLLCSSPGLLWHKGPAMHLEHRPIPHYRHKDIGLE